jgi:hypothetical protein
VKEIDPNRKTMLLLNKADLLTRDVRYDKSSMCVPFCGGLGFRQAVFFLKPFLNSGKVLHVAYRSFWTPQRFVYRKLRHS